MTNKPAAAANRANRRRWTAVMPVMLADDTPSRRPTPVADTARPPLDDARAGPGAQVMSG
ncbi:hypothetical protein Xph01_45220 [Micromonospora phaseoli]|nr:hypothetical protein Xph01_45220 [Micromonospora phaseoli]